MYFFDNADEDESKFKFKLYFNIKATKHKSFITFSFIDHFHNYSSVSCTFEEREICYYEQDQTDDLDWIWTNRGTDESFTGPDKDHTFEFYDWELGKKFYKNIMVICTEVQSRSETFIKVGKKV